MKIYDKQIMQLAAGGFGAGELQGALVARRHNPLCGDECAVYARLQNNAVAALRHKTRGCALCLAAAARLAQLAGEAPPLAELLQLGQELCRRPKKRRSAAGSAANVCAGGGAQKPPHLRFVAV